MNPGEYLGKIVEYGISETKKGDPQVFVTLQSGTDKITWFGSFTNEKAREITVKTLVDMGLEGDDVSELSDEVGLDKNKELKFKVDTETWNGKEYTKVKWVSDPNKSTFAKLDKKDAVKKLSSLNLKGLIAEAKAKAGVDEIPF